MTVRSDLHGWLKPLLPKAWRVLPYADDLDVVDVITVMLNQLKIAPAPEHPRGAHWVDFELLIIEPKTAPDTLEDSLDDAVDELLHALDDIPTVRWTVAEKVGYGTPVTNIAYQIALQVLSGKEVI